MDQGTQRILDLEAIREVHYRYCRGIDRRDWDLVRSCFHPDATDDHGEYAGGVDGLVEYAKAGTLRFESTFHMTGNQLIEIDGDAAWAERYAIAYHRLAATGDAPAADWVVNTRFVDRMERRDGEWRIARRVCIIDSQRSDPVSPVQGEWATAGYLHGRRDRNDPSYER
jgi:hypothetical protein